MKEFITDEAQLRVHNSFANYPLEGFGKQELCFFLMLCTKVKDSTDLDIRVNYREHMCPSYNSAKKVREQLKKLAEQLVCANGTFVNPEGKIVVGTFFYSFVFDDDHAICRVNKDLVDVLVNVSKHYTMLDLQQIFTLKSPYAIKLYRKLKQFEYTGKYMTNIADFRDIMGIPDTSRVNDIISRIVKPAVKELSAFFSELSVANIVDTAPGSPIVGLNFTWQAKKALTDEQKAVIEERGKKKKAYSEFDERDYTIGEMLEMEKRLLEIK